jgi:hemerythrin-like domain-containing protein
MVVIHRGLRRETRVLADLVAATRPGDRRRARTLTAHLDDYLTGLHNHHHGEDELIWPLLLSRVDLDAETVLRMEAQHEKVAATIARLRDLAGSWTRSADAAGRDALAAALTEHRAVLVEHLDDEEANLLPLAERHLTEAEWNTQGDHFVEHTPKTKILTLLGVVLEDATPDERAEFLAGLPAPARAFWRLYGERHHAARMRRLREDVRTSRAGTGLALATGLGISYVGLSYLLDPSGTAPGFGLPSWPSGDAAGWMNIKGARDLGTGLAVLALLARGKREALGLVMLAFSTIPAGDMLTVLSRHGSKATAFGVHGLTAAAVLASGVLLLRAARRR